MQEAKVAEDDARHAAQDEAVKSTVERQVNAEIAGQAAASHVGEPRIVAAADSMREAAASEHAKADRHLGQARTAARGSQFIDYAFYVVYSLLAVRLVLALIAAQSGNAFVQFIRAITDPFYAPFRGIVASPTAEGGNTLVVPIMIAIVAYALLHAAINALLRMVGTRKTEVQRPIMPTTSATRMTSPLMRRIRACGTVLSLAMIAGGAACDDVLRTEPGRGTLSVHLTDAPLLTDAVESVDVFVVRVDARRTTADSAMAAMGAPDDSADTGGWITLAMPNARIDLLAYQNGAALPIGLSTVPNGTYRAFRIVIDPSRSSVALKSGAVLTGSSTPSAGFASGDRSGVMIALARPVVVRDGRTTVVIVDFMVGESFVLRGTTIAEHGFLFNPVVRGSIRP